ncbi:Ankrd27 [Symbiodinium sp. KB8]|nr:Ankrd27 [Symbiodinium sp. KB8]
MDEAETGGDVAAEKGKPEPGGELMLFDDGSMTADKAQSSAMSLIINYADPSLAAGTAVLGLGLVVLPFLSKLNKFLQRPCPLHPQILLGQKHLHESIRQASHQLYPDAPHSMTADHRICHRCHGSFP